MSQSSYKVKLLDKSTLGIYSPALFSSLSHSWPHAPTLWIDERTIDHLVSLSASAFGSEDQWVLSGTGGNPNFVDGFFRSRLMAGVVSPQGYIYVSLIDEEIVGVALWFGPGDELYATEEQRAAYYDKWNQDRGPALVQWWNAKQASPVNQLVQNTRKDTWSLSLLAVSPRHRRRRIAYNLCKVVMDEAITQGEGVSVLTQSQDNVKFYETTGFSISGDAKIVGGSGGDYTIFALTFNWPPMKPEHNR